MPTLHEDKSTLGQVSCIHRGAAGVAHITVEDSTHGRLEPWVKVCVVFPRTGNALRYCLVPNAPEHVDFEAQVHFHTMLAGLASWNTGTAIQNALGFLSDDHREMLLNGGIDI